MTAFEDEDCIIPAYYNILLSRTAMPFNAIRSDKTRWTYIL